ncbi:MAG: hypothetical protein ACI8RD_014055 [Bacillariaceae sp.]|jgi:hypothetical protein
MNIYQLADNTVRVLDTAYNQQITLMPKTLCMFDTVILSLFYLPESTIEQRHLVELLVKLEVDE